MEGASSLSNDKDRLVRRAMAANLLIFIFCGCCALVIFADIGGLVGFLVPSSAEGIAMIGVVGWSLSYICSIIAIAMWIYRAHDNLIRAGVSGLEFTPGWSVGWFFVPFMNLVQPFQAMRELWNASFGHAFNESAPATLTAWWACLLIGNIFLNLSQGGASEALIPHTSGGLLMDVLGFGLLAASALMLYQIIRRITGAQADGLTQAVFA